MPYQVLAVRASVKAHAVVLTPPPAWCSTATSNILSTGAVSGAYAYVRSEANTRAITAFQSADTSNMGSGAWSGDHFPNSGTVGGASSVTWGWGRTCNPTTEQGWPDVYHGCGNGNVCCAL